MKLQADRAEPMLSAPPSILGMVRALP
jgi:hypothetical protein